MCQKIILYEDDSVIVAMKPANLAVQTKRIEEEDLCSLLRKHLAQENKKKQPPYLAPINRLDQPVRGLVLFAKTRAAAANLSGQLSSHQIEKIYRARIFGQFEKKEGTIRDRLCKDAQTNVSRVTLPSDPEYEMGKDAILSYEMTGEDTVKIRLLTGRHHQIRVQLSHAGHPILGDYKYGTKESIQKTEEEGIRSLCLTATELGFRHPATGKNMHLTCPEEQ